MSEASDIKHLSAESIVDSWLPQMGARVHEQLPTSPISKSALVACVAEIIDRVARGEITDIFPDCSLRTSAYVSARACDLYIANHRTNTHPGASSMTTRTLELAVKLKSVDDAADEEPTVHLDFQSNEVSIRTVYGSTTIRLEDFDAIVAERARFQRLIEAAAA